MTTRTPDKSVSCDGKVPFDTFTQANQVCKRKSKGKRDLCRMPYRCAHCHQWHVGTRSRKMTQADLLPVDAKQRAASVLVSGEQRKAAGQALVLENESGEWVERFTFLAKCYLASLPEGALFAMEDVRSYCDTCGLPEPHSHKVWGSLPRVLIKAGLPMVMTDQNRKAHSPRTHAHRVSLYRKTGGGA